MQLCEAIHSDLIILTDVDGIFDKDPNKYPDAVKFEKISYDQVENLLESRSGQEKIAGMYQIFDLLSLSILKKSKIINNEYILLKCNEVVDVNETLTNAYMSTRENKITIVSKNKLKYNNVVLKRKK